MDDCVWFLGMAENMPFPEISFTLEPGQSLLLYTDGAPKTKNGQGESFGEERLLEALTGAEGAEDAVSRAEAALNRFAAPGEREDDTTFLCLRRL